MAPTPRTFTLAALFFTAALPAAATISGVSFEATPGAPTWNEEVTVTVRGTTDCLIDLNDARRENRAGVEVLLFDVGEGCLLDPPTPHPFSFTASFGRLEPDDYQLRLEREGALVATGELTAYRLADVAFAPPSEPPTDVAPFSFTVSSFSSGCLATIGPEVEGGAISVFVSDQCPILPPGPSIRDEEIEVGPIAAGDYELRIFQSDFQGFERVLTRPLRVYDADGCVPADDRLCLNGDRFAARVSWEEFQGGRGAGHAVPLAGRDDSGLFWFFNPANVELTVKVLDGCAINDHYWLFVASNSNVEYTVTVTDTASGAVRNVRNDLGVFPPLQADTSAFPCSPPVI